MVVTGGNVWYGDLQKSVVLSRVHMYTTSGAGNNFPDMNTPRFLHACGHYLKDDKVVTISSLAD